MSGLRRREFITLLGGAAGWPLVAHAQQRPRPVVGLLSGVTLESYTDRLPAFRKGLEETGFVEGQNLVIEPRSADGQYYLLPVLAEELVRQQVAVVVAIGLAPARAAKAATANIPIVFVFGTDPVAAGLVTSFSRPEANVTGVSQNNSALGPKRLELIRELVPQISSVALLVNPANPGAEASTRDLAAMASSIRCEFTVAKATTELEISTAFTGIVQRGVRAVVVQNDAFLSSRRDQIVALAARYAMPTIHTAREGVERGGLISYAPIFKEMFRQAGIYTGRILKGAKPGDLPVVQPTKVELVINVKTAKTLGLAIPPTLLVRADEVIE